MTKLWFFKKKQQKIKRTATEMPIREEIEDVENDSDFYQEPLDRSLLLESVRDVARRWEQERPSWRSAGVEPSVSAGLKLSLSKLSSIETDIAGIDKHLLKLDSRLDKVVDMNGVDISTGRSLINMVDEMKGEQRGQHFKTNLMLGAIIVGMMCLAFT